MSAPGFLGRRLNLYALGVGFLLALGVVIAGYAYVREPRCTEGSLPHAGADRAWALRKINAGIQACDDALLSGRLVSPARARAYRVKDRASDLQEVASHLKRKEHPWQ